MSRKSRNTPSSPSPSDADESPHGDGPSKTRRKAESTELQTLGTELLELPASTMAALGLPTRLLDALDELTRIRKFGGIRRQRQYIGKLMRQLEDEQVDAIRAALDAQRQPSAAETLRLHAAENWRERLIADDQAVEQWINEHPDTDVQQLRALVRQARKDAASQQQAEAAGQALRHGRAYRALFKLVQATPEPT